MVRNVCFHVNQQFFILNFSLCSEETTAVGKVGVLVLLLYYFLQKQYCNFSKKDHFLLF